jgi:hypothetical protein
MSASKRFLARAMEQFDAEYSLNDSENEIAADLIKASTNTGHEERVTAELASIGAESNERIKQLRIDSLMLRDNPNGNISSEYLQRLQTIASIESAIAQHRIVDKLEAIRQELAWRP